MIKKIDESDEIKQNPTYPYVSNHSYRISFIISSGSGKTNSVLLNLIKHQRPDIEVYL